MSDNRMKVDTTKARPKGHPLKIRCPVCCAGVGTPCVAMYRGHRVRTALSKQHDGLPLSWRHKQTLATMGLLHDGLVNLDKLAQQPEHGRE